MAWAGAFRRSARLSCGHVEQTLDQGADFPLAGPPGERLLDFPPQRLALQRLALVVVRRPTRRLVPGAGAAVAHLVILLVPGPHFHQGVHPQVEVEARLVAVHVTHLLLPGPPDLLLILE